MDGRHLHAGVDMNILIGWSCFSAAVLFWVSFQQGEIPLVLAGMAMGFHLSHWIR